MVWWLVLIIVAAQYALGALLQPKPEDAKPDEGPDFPTNSETLNIPITWGEVLIQDPNTLWHGDFKAEPIKKRVFNGLFFRSYIAGYKYHLGLIQALCWGKTPQGNSGIDIRKILCEERVLWTHPENSSKFSAIRIDEPTFFGSETQEGGLHGTFIIHHGEQWNAFPVVPSTYWEGQMGTTMPSYQDLAYIEWPGYSTLSSADGNNLRRQGWMGNSGRAAPFAFLVRRHASGLISGLPFIGLENSFQVHHNPIFALAELYTDDSWGDQIPVSRLGSSWETAAATCEAEKLAWSYRWNREGPVKDMAAEILRFVDGVVYTDLFTGKLELVLARDDYDPETLDEISNDDNVEILNLKRSALVDTKNELRVLYTDHDTPLHETRAVIVRMPGNTESQGATIAASVHYPGCPNSKLAVRLGMRDLKALSLPLWRGTLKLDGKFYKYHPGKVFKFTWPEEGIDEVIMRVTRIKYGTIKDQTIEIEFIEDVFAAGTQTYAPAGDTLWTDPIGAAADVVNGGVSELPFWYQKDDQMRVIGYAERPGGLGTIAYDAYLNGEVSAEDLDFTATGTLKNAYQQLTDPTDTSGALILENVTDKNTIVGTISTEISALGSNLALLVSSAGVEWIAFESVTFNNDGTVTLNSVWRGVLDTPPINHPAGARIWFTSYDAAICEDTFANGTAVNFKPVSKGVRSGGSFNNAPQFSVTTARRALRAYPPRFVRVNTSYTDEVFNAVDLDLDWRESNRLTETAVVKQDNTTTTPEDDTTYTLRIYGETDQLLRTETGITATSYTYENTTEMADSGKARLESRLEFKLFSVRDGLESTYPWTRRVIRDVGGSGGTFTLPMIVINSTNATPVGGGGNFTLPMLTISGSSALGIQGQGQFNCPVPTISATGGASSSGGGTWISPTPQITGSGSTIIGGSGSFTIP